jgi:hypothetical protein
MTICRDIVFAISVNWFVPANGRTAPGQRPKVWVCTRCRQWVVPGDRHGAEDYCVFFIPRRIRSDICFIMPDISPIIFDISDICSGVIFPLTIM